MSILKYIMRPFVQFEENEQKVSSEKPLTQPGQEMASSSGEEQTTSYQPQTQGIPAAPVAPVSASPASSATTVHSTAASTNYQKHFEDLMEEANANNPMFSGTDFKEFLESTVDIEAITDEATRYKTAFNVLKRTGLTKERLVSTGREYINVIENDLKGFEEAFAQQYKIEVEQKEALLQQKAQELQLLNDKITTLNQEVKDISSTLTESKEKLNTNKEAFIRAGEQKKKELLAELQKIDQHFM
jgi:hypothetical protein